MLQVCQRFNEVSQRLLNRGFYSAVQYHAKCLKEVGLHHSILLVTVNSLYCSSGQICPVYLKHMQKVGAMTVNQTHLSLLLVCSNKFISMYLQVLIADGSYRDEVARCLNYPVLERSCMVHDPLNYPELARECCMVHDPLNYPALARDCYMDHGA